MQNTSPIFSAPASDPALVPFRRVKIIAGGVAYADAGDSAVGTLLAGDPGCDTQAAVQDLTFGLHFATIGNATVVAFGDELEGAASGKLVKRTTGAAVAVALEGNSAVDDVIRVKYLTGSRAMNVLAAGIRVWAGGAAPTDTIPVAGLVATDIVLATLVVKSGTQYLVSAINNGVAHTITVTLSANGGNGTESIAWVAIRP